MEKRNLMLTLISLFSIVCTGCGGNPESNSSYEDNKSTSEGPAPIVLQEDKREGYEIDNTVSNKNASTAYELFVRSFYDTDNDGIGDLNGVIQKLDYIESLGIKTIWLMPINPSPTYHGYDVKDYYDINPAYGTLQDFDNLIKEAGKRNIDIMMDMVFNHSSIQNPWFEQSYVDKIEENDGPDSKADWYNWGEKYSCSYNELNYEGEFDASMPDFNLDSPTLRQEIDKICKFWIEKGVKGFRLDAVIHYFEGRISKNVEVLNFIKETCRKYDPNFYLVGEAWTSDMEIKEYAKSTCDSFFRFSSSVSGTGNESLTGLINLLGNATRYSLAIQDVENMVKKVNPDYYYSYFLSNHDMDRPGSIYRDEDRLKAALSVIGLMPGMTYTYYGDEIMLKGKRNTSPEDYSDARRRLPMIWNEKDKTGECDFPESHRYDLMDNDQVKKGVEDLDKEGYSSLNHLRKVYNVRNKFPFLLKATYVDKTAQREISGKKGLVYSLVNGSDSITVAHNLSSEAITIDLTDLPKNIVEEINTTRLLPEVVDNTLKLAPYSTVILQ